MLYNGVMITQASGRIADSVASRNRGGAYFRALGNPNPNPPTDLQIAVRQSLADASAAWTSLPEVNQASWSDFAKGLLRSNRIGTRFARTGRDEYIRVNSLRQQANYIVSSDFATVNTVPTTSVFTDIGVLPTASFVSTHELSIVFDSTRPWWTNAKAGMLVWISPPLAATRHYHKSPMVMVGYVKGLDGTTSPLSVSSPDGVTSGQHVKLRFRWMGLDGQLSETYWLDVAQP